jgi:hypothetical protein
MNWLMYAVPEQRVMHYVALLTIITVFMPMFILNKPWDSVDYFNRFIIFDGLYYVFFEKLNFTNDD